MSDEIDNTALVSSYETILSELGEDLDREGLHNTPMRAAKAMRAITRGYGQSLDDIVNGAVFESGTDEMIVVKSIELYDIEVMVVSEQNLEKFLEEFRDGNGQLAIIAMSVRGYQNMALNISEMERYIRQQQEVIVYYEKAIAPKEKDISENGPAPTK